MRCPKLILNSFFRIVACFALPLPLLCAVEEIEESHPRFFFLPAFAKKTRQRSILCCFQGEEITRKFDPINTEALWSKSKKQLFDGVGFTGNRCPLPWLLRLPSPHHSRSCFMTSSCFYFLATVLHHDGLNYRLVEQSRDR